MPSKTCSTTKKSCSTTSKTAPVPTLPSYIKGTYGTMYYVKNMAASVAFYKEKLGLTPMIEDAGWSQFDLNGHGLCLNPVGDKKITAGHTQLIIRVDDIEKTVGMLKERRVEFVGAMADTGCGFCAEFKDVDGNLVGLYQAKKQ